MINDKTSALLAALMARSTPVEVEGFGTVLVRQITVGENDAISKIATNKDAPVSEFGLQLLIRAVSDESGAPMFDDADLPALRDASSTKIDKIVKAVLVVNGFQKADEEKN